MKKIAFYWLLLLPILSFADLDINKVTKVLLSLEQNKSLKYFNESKSLMNKFQVNSNGLHFSSLKEADILFMSKITKDSKLVITDSYEKLQKSNKNVIGAVYIKKDRTHIFLIKERLKKSGLKVPYEMNKYLISECYLNLVCLLATLDS